MRLHAKSEEPTMTRTGLVSVLAVLAALAACSTTNGKSTAFELGAAEFHGGDTLVLDEVRSSTGTFAPGSLVTIRGRYRLASRESGTLHFGTTVQEGADAGPAEPKARLVVARGGGTFELEHRVPSPGHLHVTFYDVVSGQPFGGQYFGKGESLLVAKSWPYAR